jgi:hypothetical protein
VSLVPVPSAEQPEASCANCSAPLLADQRYCLSCGQPVTPVRLAFLDALTPAPSTIEIGPAGYIPVESRQGPSAWLRRNSGLMGLLTVLVLCLLAGLLVGHWVSQSKAPANQTIKVEGLAGLAGAGAASSAGVAAATTPASTTPAAAAKSTAGKEAAEAAEGTHETAAEKAPPKKPVAVAPTKIQKLTNSTGKKHQEEINALGATPIETR